MAPQLSRNSALFNRATRRRKLAQAPRDHLDLVERLQRPKQPNGAAARAAQRAAPKPNGARDTRREALASAIATVGEAEAALQAARLVVDKKRQESWQAKRAVKAAQGIVSEARNDFDAAGEHNARAEARRYLEAAAERHAQWVVDKELGKPVGAEPPSVEHIKRQVEAAQARANEIDAVRARLNVEVQRRQADVEHARASVKNAAGKVLTSAFDDLVECYLAQRDRLAVLRENVRLLYRAADVGPEHRFWDSLANEPQNCTGALKQAIESLERDPDADLSAVLAAIKEGRAAASPKPRDEVPRRPADGYYGAPR